MAEIKRVVSGNVTVWKVIGHPKIEELVGKLREFYNGNLPRKVVWDLSEASLGQLKFDDFERLAEFMLKYAHTRAGGKAAIISPNDLEYGFGRTVDLLATQQKAPFETYTFRQPAEAAKWLGGKELPTVN